jgi:NAD(P)-dependent dehydrogenase (short-subunit alcohol dehydrogenase family)
MERSHEKGGLITGASHGIGKGIAQRFADEGAGLILAPNKATALIEEMKMHKCMNKHPSKLC